MRLIAHRGNSKGRNTTLENHPDYIEEALRRGFDCEVDVWAQGKMWLGHDLPEWECRMSFLFEHSDKLWIHCKNLEALEILSSFKRLNVFWHQKDDFTLTSKGFIWTYPNKEVCKNSVIVHKEPFKKEMFNCYGICSDVLEK